MFGSSIEISREVCQITERRESIVNHSGEERRSQMLQAPSANDRVGCENETTVVGEVRPRRLAEFRAFIVVMTGGNQTRRERREAGR